MTLIMFCFEEGFIQMLPFLVVNAGLYPTSLSGKICYNRHLGFTFSILALKVNPANFSPSIDLFFEELRLSAELRAPP